MGKKNSKNMITAFLAVIILVFVDQVTKYLAVIKLKDSMKNSFELISGVFELRYLENQSAAFGIDIISVIQKIFNFSYWTENPMAFLKAKMIFFSIITILVVVFLVYWYRRIPNTKRFRLLNFILVLFVSGAIGNLIDRVANNYVVDFFYFKLIDFPIFNVADIYVTIAAFLFIVLGFFYYKEEDFEIIFYKSKKDIK